MTSRQCIAGGRTWRWQTKTKANQYQAQYVMGTDLSQFRFDLSGRSRLGLKIFSEVAINWRREMCEHSGFMNVVIRVDALPTGWAPFHNTLGSPSKVINFNDDCLRDNIANLKEKLTSFRNGAETSRGELMVGLYHEARVIVRKFLDGDVCVGLFTQLSFLSSSWPYIMW